MESQSKPNDILFKSIEIVKMLNVGNITCEYHNIEKNTMTNDKVQTSNFMIKNHACKVIGTQLVKRTQIFLPDKDILIEDCYDFTEKNFSMNDRTVLPSTSGSSTEKNQENQKNESSIHQGQSLKQKKLIFKKRKTNGNSQKTYDKRNTKNIAKNFSKAFQIHLGQFRKNQAIEKLKKFIEQTNYNNKLIQKISQEPQLNWQFQNFLEHSAYNWIQTSKIVDKQIHLEAIELYLKIAKAKDFIQQSGNSAVSRSNSDRS